MDSKISMSEHYNIFLIYLLYIMEFSDKYLYNRNTVSQQTETILNNNMIFKREVKQG